MTCYSQNYVGIIYASLTDGKLSEGVDSACWLRTIVTVKSRWREKIAFNAQMMATEVVLVGLTTSGSLKK